jgi:hypothetical protein
MARSTVGVLGLAALVVLAGCNGGITDGDGTRTVTPAPVPSATPGGPPGVSPDDVAPDELADAHQSLLAATNYTVVIDERVADGNRTLRETSRRRYVADGGREYRTVRHEVIDYPATALAADTGYRHNSTTTRYRLTDDDPTESNVRGSGSRHDPTNRDRLVATVGAFQVRLVDRTGDTYRLESTRLVQPRRLPTPAGLDGPHNASLSLVVGQNGVVYGQDLTYDATLGPRNETVHVTRTVQFVSIGETTVRGPTQRGRYARNSGE